MKSIKKALFLLLSICMLVCVLNGCKQDPKILTSFKCSVYTEDSNGSETFKYYTINTLYRDGTQVTECFSPSGTLWYTIDEEGTTYKPACTAEIREMLDQPSIISLIGTGSTDIVQEVKKNDAGLVTDEYLYSKSGAYPAIHIVYDYIVLPLQ